MASYAVLTTLARTIDETLNDPQLSPFIHEKEKMKSLHHHITQLRAFIDRNREKAIENDEEIKELASKAEKLVDSYMTLVLDSYCRSPTKSEKSEAITSPVTSVSVEEEMNGIATRIEKITIADKDDDHRLHRTATSSTTEDSSTTGPEDKMIGFEADFDSLQARLNKDKTKLEVIPVYGLGGIGKTTLARKLSQDPMLVEYFHVVAWLRVSKEYDLEQMLTKLLSFVKHGKGEVSKDKSLDVYQNLKGKRFFIILDDVWTLDVWDEFRRLLPDESNGSRVLLTTRLIEVANCDDFAKPIHEMKLMDPDQSWKLLAYKLSDKIKNFPEALERIGREIAKICMGLPLTIVVMAGILRELNPDPRSWLDMAEKVKADSNEAGQLQKTLAVSYEHLPFYLRSCFLYMGFFSDYADIRLSNLTKLWVAESFLKPPSQPSKSDEVAAEEYLEDLVRRNLVFRGVSKSYGKIKSCGIHDLVRDMCQKTSDEEGFLQHVKDRYPKRLDDDEEETDSSNWPQRFKSYSDSIQAVQSFKNSKGTLDLARSFRMLKTLELMKVEFRSFPDEVLELFLLKYLGLGHVAEVPPTISRLWNLEALVIHPRAVSTSYLPYIVCFPPSIWTMTKLRHLVSFSYGILPTPGEGSCKLENLQTLNAIVNLQCKEWISKMIPNVKKLGIYFVGIRKDEYSLENLELLEFLEKLKLSVLVPFSAPQKLNVAFPKTLRKLTLRGCRLEWKFMTTISSLPNLEVLKLKRLSFQGDEWETEEEFPALKFLVLEELGLEKWTITEKDYFPKLKTLIIKDCEDLEKLDESVGDFNSIELIEIVGSNRPLVASVKEIQQYILEDLGNTITVLIKSYA